MLDLDKILHAYRMGLFPMAMHTDALTYQWVKPQMRGVIYMEKFHIPKSLTKFMKHSTYQFTKDQAFEAVIEACREVTKDRQESWINDEIKAMFVALYEDLKSQNFTLIDTQFVNDHLMQFGAEEILDAEFMRYFV